MKRLFKKLLLVACSCAVAFGFVFTPVSASAEEVTQVPEIEAEVPKNEEDNGAVEETPETEDNVENTPEISVEQEKEITLDDLLALVGNLAENEGLGEEWNDTMEQLKLAVEDKKIDATLIVNILILSAIIGYLIFKTFGRAVAWIKRKKNPSTVAEDLQGVKKTSIAQTEAVNKQTKAINALAETDEHVAQTVEKENEKLNALAAAQIEMNTALRTLIRGTNIKAELKDEAYRALNKSNEHCDNAQK